MPTYFLSLGYGGIEVAMATHGLLNVLGQAFQAKYGPVDHLKTIGARKLGHVSSSLWSQNISKVAYLLPVTRLCGDLSCYGN